MIGDFHFLRPWWLLAVIPAALVLIALYRGNDAARPWRAIVAPHLLPYLLQSPQEQSRFRPIYLLAAAALVAILALAGPTWKREPAPFARDAAALAIVIRVVPTMQTADIEPSRLARSVQKIHDLLAGRGSAKTSLIAYAGSAHRVMPATTDAAIIDTFAAALDPKIMPVDGDAAAEALALAASTLGGNSGSILWITDSISPEQAGALAAWHKTARVPVQLLAPLPEGTELNALREAAKAVDAKVTVITPDAADITGLARTARLANVAAGDATARWQDAGYYGLPLLALLVLPFFRRGFLVPAVARS